MWSFSQQIICGSLIKKKTKNFSLYHLLQQLEESLNDFGHKWELNPGDGAFYGPKVHKT